MPWMLLVVVPVAMQVPRWNTAGRSGIDWLLHLLLLLLMNFRSCFYIYIYIAIRTLWASPTTGVGQAHGAKVSHGPDTILFSAPPPSDPEGRRRRRRSVRITPKNNAERDATCTQGNACISLWACLLARLCVRAWKPRLEAVSSNHPAKLSQRA
jgi:hypothetical protein